MRYRRDQACLIQVAAVRSSAGLRLTTRMALRTSHWLELDYALTQAAFARVHDLLQFGDDRLRRAIADRVNANGLIAAHPVDVKTHGGVYRQVRRSAPVPWISNMLRVESARTLPGLVANESISFRMVCADTY